MGKNPFKIKIFQDKDNESQETKIVKKVQLIPTVESFIKESIRSAMLILLMWPVIKIILY